MYSLPLPVSLEYAEDLLGTLQTEFRLNSDELSQAQELLNSGLPPLVKPEILSFLFGISYRLILSMARFPSTYYRVYKVSKKGGGTRQIEAPRQFLKLVQKWIYVHILSKRQLPSSVMGFVPGKNIFSNAKVHLQSKNLMVVDIDNFFPSVGEKQVSRIFRSFGFPTKVANRLAGLCTFEFRLPQGAPTSPALANLAFEPTDRALEDLARSWDCVYTRYADDLAFSGDTVFRREDMEEVAQILQQSGFSINYRKSRILGGGARQILAGLVVNQSGLPPREKRMRWRSTFHHAALDPTKYIGQSSELKGIAAFINEYDNVLAQKYWHIANQVAELE